MLVGGGAAVVMWAVAEVEPLYGVWRIAERLENDHHNENIVLASVAKTLQ